MPNDAVSLIVHNGRGEWIGRGVQNETEILFATRSQLAADDTENSQ
jgi:glucan biosynthesis protein